MNALTVCFQSSPELNAEIVAAAARHGVTKSVFMRRAICDYVEVPDDIERAITAMREITGLSRSEVIVSLLSRQLPKTRAEVLVMMEAAHGD